MQYKFLMSHRYMMVCLCQMMDKIEAPLCWAQGGTNINATQIEGSMTTPQLGSILANHGTCVSHPSTQTPCQSLNWSLKHDQDSALQGEKWQTELPKLPTLRMTIRNTWLRHLLRWMCFVYKISQKLHLIIMLNTRVCY